MDPDIAAAARQNLEIEKGTVQRWLNHALGQRYLESLRSQEETTINLILDRTPFSIETFIAHFELVGFLRATRNAKRLLQERADEIEEELKQTEPENTNDDEDTL